MVLIKSVKILGAGLATISITGAGVGIGVVFGSLVLASSINPDKSDLSFSYAILGFALTESIALFGLMMSFLLLYGSF